MGKFVINYSDRAVADLKKIKKSGNLSNIKKITTFLQEIEENPRQGTGTPERLKHYQGEIWSRKINKKDRLVYEIFEQEVSVIIIQSLGHYNDK